MKKTIATHSLIALLTACIAASAASSPFNESNAPAIFPPVTNSPPLLSVTIEDEVRTVKAIAREALANGFDEPAHAQALRGRISKLVKALQASRTGTNTQGLPRPARTPDLSPANTPEFRPTAPVTNAPPSPSVEAKRTSTDAALRRRMADLEGSVLRLRDSVNSIPPQSGSD